MKNFAFAIFVIFGAIALSVPSRQVSADTNARYMAFCIDGDGALSGWLMTREEALLDGRDHERTTRGHRWEVWTEDGKTTSRAAVCSRIVPGAKPDTVTVENTCDKCSRFLVARTNADGSVTAKEIKINPKKGRTFRVLPNTKVTVDTERDCSP